MSARDIWVVQEGGALHGEYARDRQMIADLKGDGTRYKITLKQPRSGKRHRRYWAMLADVVEHTALGDSCPTSEHLHDRVMFSLGYVTPHAVGGPTTLENAQALCVQRSVFKTSNGDVPRIAKNVRGEEKRTGVRRTSRPIPGSRASGIRKRMNGLVGRW